MRCGRSGSVTAVKPRSALRWISAAPFSGSVRNVMPRGMIRSGYGDHHSSWSQSFQACVVAQPRAGSWAWENTRPQKPVIIDGKFIDAQTPLRSMSRMRSWMSQQPRRMSLEAWWAPGSSCSWSRPATAFIPTWVNSCPSNSHTSWPRSLVTTFGARSWRRAGRRPSNMSGGSTRWSSTEMIVYRTSPGSGSGSRIGSSAMVIGPPRGCVRSTLGRRPPSTRTDAVGPVRRPRGRHVRQAGGRPRRGPPVR